MAALISEVSGTWYVCDPEKNKECRKRMCGKCNLTSCREYAQTDEDGRPVRCHVYRRYRESLGWDYFLEVEKIKA